MEPFEFVILNNAVGQFPVESVPCNKDSSDTRVGEFEVLWNAIYSGLIDIVYQTKLIFRGNYQGGSQGYTQMGYVLEDFIKLPWYNEFHYLVRSSKAQNQMDTVDLDFSEAVLKRIGEIRGRVIDERTVEQTQMQHTFDESEKFVSLSDEDFDLIYLTYVAMLPQSANKLNELLDSHVVPIQPQVLRELVELACVEVFCLVDLCCKELQGQSTLNLIRVIVYKEKAKKCLEIAEVLCRQFLSLSSGENESRVTVQENSRNALNVRHALSREQRGQAEKRWIELKSEGRSKNAAASILKRELKTFSETTYRSWLQSFD
jgi:hypothetical protein